MIFAYCIRSDLEKPRPITPASPRILPGNSSNVSPLYRWKCLLPTAPARQEIPDWWAILSYKKEHSKQIKQQITFVEVFQVQVKLEREFSIMHHHRNPWLVSDHHLIWDPIQFIQDCKVLMMNNTDQGRVQARHLEVSTGQRGQKNYFINPKRKRRSTI